jgi:Mrp family chromosome partitioning ATPase
VLTVCWAAKGGSGTTVVACALALLAAATQESSWLVDLAGDAPSALGLPEPSGPGAHEWLHSSALPHALESLGVPAGEQLLLIPRGRDAGVADATRWGQLGQFLAEGATSVIVDAGSAPPPPQLAAAAQRRLLVIRPCYLALRRAVASAVTPTGVIVIHEPGRALRAQDVAYAVQAPVVAELTTDPAVARAVDAGLLASRLPRTLAVALRELVP